MKRTWIVLTAFVAVLSTARGGELYRTNFDAFPVGDNNWSGTEGWISNDNSSGAQGIVEDFVAGLDLGKTAYLGFEVPTSPFTTVARPVNYDPALGGFQSVEFDSFLGVQDSTNGQRDSFFISFYDIGGSFLGAIVFDNNSPEADVLRWQGMADASVQSTKTGVPFFPGDPDPLFGFVSLQILNIRIDLANNTWSAQLDGIPLFVDAPFAGPGLAPLTLGSVAAEWELADPVPAKAGDNWLFVADWRVRTIPKGTEPFFLESIDLRNAADPTITWLGEAGFDYQVWYSSDLRSWKNDLPDSSLPGITQAGLLSFSDPGAAPLKRFYRVERTLSP